MQSRHPNTSGSPASADPSRRDPRVDLLRGLALVCIFFDHMPGDSLSLITMQNYGFSDAAELFVFLAGYSATIAYGRVLDRDGTKALLTKVARRCLNIYATHAGLFLATLFVLAARTYLSGLRPTLLAPIIDDGLDGVMRGLSLKALPAYLDILPLYLVLLAALPCVLFLMRQSVPGTVALSLALYFGANVYHCNLPNHVDRLLATTWTFNPFTWQLIYVLGSAFGSEHQKNNRFFASPSMVLRSICCAYLLFAFLSERQFGAWLGFSEADLPLLLFGNDPKIFLTPWRVFHVLAIAYLALTSSRLAFLARRDELRPVLACGRHSLTIFGSSCVLALLGRIVFNDFGHGGFEQACVNAAGLSLMLWLALVLDQRERSSREARGTRSMPLTRQAS